MLTNSMTKPVSVASVRNNSKFRRGYRDKVMNWSYPKDYDEWDTNSQWYYERGRHFACINPSYKLLYTSNYKSYDIELDRWYIDRELDDAFVKNYLR